MSRKFLLRLGSTVMPSNVGAVLYLENTLQHTIKCMSIAGLALCLMV